MRDYFIKKLGGYTKKEYDFLKSEVQIEISKKEDLLYSQLKTVTVEIQASFDETSKNLLLQSGFINRLCKAFFWKDLY